ncbi:hypothetical protein D3C79_483410 [compost metagenome]
MLQRQQGVDGQGARRLHGLADPLIAGQPLVELFGRARAQHLLQALLGRDGPQIGAQPERSDDELVPLLQIHLAGPPYGRGRAVNVGLAAQIAQAEAAILALDPGVGRHHGPQPVSQLPVILLGGPQGPPHLVEAVLPLLVAVELLAVEHHQGKLLVKVVHIHSCTQMVTNGSLGG